MHKELMSDLGIFSELYEEDAIFKRFDFTLTDGGRRKLKMLLSPEQFQYNIIVIRQACIKAICSNPESWNINWNNSEIYYINTYLDTDRVIQKVGGSNLKASAKGIYLSNFKKRDFLYMESGVKLMLSFFNRLDIIKIDTRELPPFLSASITAIRAFITSNQLDKYFEKDKKNGLNAAEVLLLDEHFRAHEHKNIKDLLDYLFEIEAYISLAKATIKYGLNFPTVDHSISDIEIKGLFHPLLKQCTRNDFIKKRNENVVFLTGPNMSGKSTFLKALGLCIYFSHIGLPVPADMARLPFFDELHSNINSADSISGGYSHFKAELNKVKSIAYSLRQEKKVFVIIDELFKGTNLIDAYDCAKEVITSFTSYTDSYFVISSHIIELANELDQLQKVTFKCFDGKLADQDPVFNYTLQPGVCSMRLGYYLLKQEGIIDILNNKIKQIESGY